MLDPVEVGADLGGEDGLGLVLLDHVLIQVRLQLLGLHIELDLVDRASGGAFLVLLL